MANVYNKAGMVLDMPNLKLVKKSGAKGELIAKHNHPEADVTFCIVKGKIKVLINDIEEHIVTPGDILYFDGDNYISAELLEDSEAFVHLVLKK